MDAPFLDALTALTALFKTYRPSIRSGACDVFPEILQRKGRILMETVHKEVNILYTPYFLDPEKMDLLRWASIEERERLIAQWDEEERQEREAYRKRQARRYDNARLFLEEGILVYDPDGTISSQELYRLYRLWCIREELPLKPPREFWLHIKEAGPRHGLCYSSSLKDREGKRCRGFRGARAPREESLNT